MTAHSQKALLLNANKPGTFLGVLKKDLTDLRHQSVLCLLRVSPPNRPSEHGGDPKTRSPASYFSFSSKLIWLSNEVKPIMVWTQL